MAQKKKQHKRQGPEIGPGAGIERSGEQLLDRVLEGLKEVVRSEPIVKGPDCLEDEALLGYLSGQSAPESAEKVVEHLCACRRCRLEARDLAKDLDIMG
jgi:hypothetical protein